MTTVRIFSFLVCSTLLAAAGCGGGGGGGGGGQCIADGLGCPSSGFCCSKSCVNGMCAGGAGPDLAMPMQGSDLATQMPDLAMKACTPQGGDCAQAADCCNGLPCTAGKCQAGPQKKRFGEPCTDDTDCQTAICVGIQGVSGRFCSAACTKSTDCAALSANPVYWCVAGGGGVSFCIRSCKAKAECTDIGNAWSCRQGKSIENVVQGLCGVFRSQAAGTPCLDNGQCAKGACNDLWCADPCANDAACGTGAKCFLNNNQAFVCFPTCTGDSDCLIYGLGNQLTCKSGTSRDGATHKICSG